MARSKEFVVDDAVEAAMRVFWTYGYPHSTLDSLTRATGLGKGSLYATFGSKSELFERCLSRYVEVYGGRYRAALAAHPDDPVGAVGAFFDAILRRLADPAVPDGCLLSQSLADVHTLDPGGQALAARLLGQQVDAVRAAIGPSGLPARELGELARLVVAVNQGITVMHRAGASVASLRSIARNTCTLLATRLDPAVRVTGR